MPNMIRITVEREDYLHPPISAYDTYTAMDYSIDCDKGMIVIEGERVNWLIPLGKIRRVTIGSIVA